MGVVEQFEVRARRVAMDGAGSKRLYHWGHGERRDISEADHVTALKYLTYNCFVNKLPLDSQIHTPHS